MTNAHEKALDEMIEVLKKQGDLAEEHEKQIRDAVNVAMGEAAAKTAADVAGHNGLTQAEMEELFRSNAKYQYKRNPVADEIAKNLKERAAK